jgi:hypothetical protein
MKTILWSAFIAGGLLLGGAAGVSAAPAATGSAIEAALADVVLIEDVRYGCGRHCVKRDRCGRCVRWKAVPCCPPVHKPRPYGGYKPKKPRY